MRLSSIIPTAAIASLVAMASLLSACDGSAGNDPRSALSAARDKWRRAAIDDYRVEVEYGCFCPPAYTTRTRIEVRDGSVVAAVPLDSIQGTAVPLDQWYTVDEMFLRIQAAIDRDEIPTVVYDAALGYPVSGSFACPENVTDCGFDFAYGSFERID